ncbi:MAG: hypothetical protein J7K23_00165 [Thermoproteales archaeon]|nr:hypothetical protein [Thermoproteales archaeon]
MSLAGYKSPEEALKKLSKRKKEIEMEFEFLHKKLEKGEIDKNVFDERKKKLEKEFIEIMDRLAQLKYITGSGGW